MEPKHRAADPTVHPNATDWMLVADLDVLLPRVRDGRLALDDVLPAVLAATLLVYARTSHDPHVHGFADASTGRLVVPACTAAEHVPAAWPLWREMRGSALVPLLAGKPLLLNPEGPASTLISAASLTDSPR